MIPYYHHKFDIELFLLPPFVLIHLLQILSSLYRISSLSTNVSLFGERVFSSFFTTIHTIALHYSAKETNISPQQHGHMATFSLLFITPKNITLVFYTTSGQKNMGNVSQLFLNAHKQKPPK